MAHHKAQIRDTLYIPVVLEVETHDEFGNPLTFRRRRDEEVVELHGAEEFVVAYIPEKVFKNPTAVA